MEGCGAVVLVCIKLVSVGHSFLFHLQNMGRNPED